MIIDFRVRPPAKGFDTLSILGEGKSIHPYPFNADDTDPVPSAMENSMPLFFQEMEEEGICKAVVMPRQTYTSWGSVSNDAVADLAREYPDKLICYGAIDVGMGIRESVEEVERLVTTLGLRGIVVEPGCCTPPRQPDAAQLYPLYDRCAQLGVPVAISQSMYLGPDVSYASPDSVQRVARDFPSLKIIISHASFPWIVPAAAVAVTTPNVYLLPDIYMHVARVPGSDMYAQAVHFTQGKRIIFGSAYPIRGFAQSVREVQRFNLPEKYYRMVMYENAVELLGL